MNNTGNVFTSILAALQAVNENIIIIGENLAQTHALTERVAEAISPAPGEMPAPARRVERQAENKNNDTL